MARLNFHSYGHGHYGRMSSRAIREDIVARGLSLMEEHLNYKQICLYIIWEYDERVSKIVEVMG